MTDFISRIVLDRNKTVEFHGPADITKETTEAIVNAANSSLMGGGGVDGAIHRAGGPSILAECRRIIREIGSLPTGRAVITTAGRLSARYVIHTVGPVYSNGARGEPQKLASCYRESIRVADEHGMRSVAFPSISTGIYGYPVEDAARVAVPAVLDSLTHASTLDHVRFVLFDTHTLHAYLAAAAELCAEKSEYRLEKAPS